MMNTRTMRVFALLIVASMIFAACAPATTPTAAAFISMILPMLVFFGLQRFFVHGMLSGSIKG